MKGLRRLSRYVRPEAWRLSAAYLCMILVAAGSTLYAVLAGPAVEFVFSGSLGDVIRSDDGQLRALFAWLPSHWVETVESLSQQEAIWVVPLLIIATASMKGMGQAGQFYLTGKVSQRILRALRRDTFASLLRQSPAFYHKRTHGDLLSRLTNDANLVEQALFYGCAPLLREPITVLFLLAYCFVSNPKLAILTFIIIPVALVPLIRFAKRLKRVSQRGQSAQGVIQAVGYEALAGAQIVQAFNAEEHELSRLDRAADGYFSHMLRSYLVRAVRSPVMEVLGAVALGGLLALLGHQALSGAGSPAQYLSFFVAVVMMYDPLKRLGRVSDYLANGAAASERIFEIVDLPPDIRDAPNATPLTEFHKAITFHNVTFAYQDEPVLRDLNLDIVKGEVTALVGSSGAGKTTLLNLVPRFFDVQQGAITFDGQDVRNITLASLREHVSMVTQDTFLFNATVGENIGYGLPDTEQRVIEEAAKAAHAHMFIMQLPQGYDTPIGERGVRLSGGQRQRIAIARALLRDAPILLLDEATSSLDSESERLVQQALDVLMEGRTTLVIAHRLSTVRHARTIAVLKNGLIIEQGNHQELLAQQGEYARLCDLQFEGQARESA